jgi:hypothetical protein
MYGSEARSSLDNHLFQSHRPSVDHLDSPEEDYGALRFHRSPDRESFMELGSPGSPPSSFHFYESPYPKNPAQSPNSPDSNPSPSSPLASPPRSSAVWLMRPSLSAARRAVSVDPPSRRKKAGSREQSPSHGTREPLPALPPTTNMLNSQERADLIKKTRKITRLFGQTPDVISSQYPDGLASRLLLPAASGLKKGHLRGAASVASSIEASGGQGAKRSVYTPQRPHYTSASGRRHSAPMSPDRYSFLSELDLESRSRSPLSVSEGHQFSIEVGSEQGMSQSDIDHQLIHDMVMGSPTSFMDLSEGDHHDDTATIAGAPPSPGSRRLSQFSVVTPSILEHMSPEERAEEERKRKRDRLAKLHRYLGSRVPLDLVLDLPPDSEGSLPAPAAVLDDWEDGQGLGRRRRSSSAAVFPTHWSDEIDRMKEDLDEHEKAINVRRALKMERVRVCCSVLARGAHADWCR